MHVGKIVWGAILILIALYLIIFLTNPAARFIGGGIVAILGLASLITGLMKKKEKKEETKEVE